MKTFEKEFKEYYEACYSKRDTSENQRVETKQAFYSGAYLILNRLMDSVKNNTEQTDMTLLYLEILRELSPKISDDEEI